MAPDPGDPVSSAPSLPAVSFSPGDIEGFADQLDAFVGFLSRRHATFNDFANQTESGEVPNLGTFQPAQGFLQAHASQAQAANVSLHNIVRQLESLRDASREIAQQFRGVEELNASQSAVIQQLLAEAAEDYPPEEQGSVPTPIGSGAPYSTVPESGAAAPGQPAGPGQAYPYTPEATTGPGESVPA